MQHPDEGTIHAWLDGALSPDESADLEAHAASCPECSAAIAEARGLIAASSRIVSALDIGPGGVIPVRKPAPRPWYSSTQLRAAAAVIFVAGASFLLVRDRGTPTLSDVAQRAMTEQAQPISAQADEDGASLKQVAPPKPAPSPTANASPGREPSQKKAEGTRAASGTAGGAAEAGQSAADAVVTPPPAADAIIAAAPPVAESRDVATLGKTVAAAAPVVVTGATTTSQKLSSDLRVLGVDSAAGRRVTRYRIASGAELTLTELEDSFTGRGVAARERRFDAARPSAPVPAPAVVEPRTTGAEMSRVQASVAIPVLTISWTDPATQRVYTLAGRVSRETLEEVKLKIQAEKR